MIETCDICKKQIHIGEKMCCAPGGEVFHYDCAVKSPIDIVLALLDCEPFEYEEVPEE